MPPVRPLPALLLLLALATTAAGAERRSPSAGKAAPLDEAPKLISTTGGGPQWRSLKELEAAASKGDPKACYDLALLCLEGGSDVKQDVPRALALYTKAAEGGIADAWFRLGKIHHDGVGVPVDRARGYDYYLKAAKLGIPEAQYNVGAMLASGRGVRRDYPEALAWLIVATKSGAAGDGEKLLRERLARRPRDITAGEKRAAELQQALAQGGDVSTRPARAASPAPTPAPKPLPPPPAIERPTFRPEPSAPQVEMPVAPIAPPPKPVLPGQP